jgi:hypothetical protein
LDAYITLWALIASITLVALDTSITLGTCVTFEGNHVDVILFDHTEVNLGLVRSVLVDHTLNLDGGTSTQFFDDMQ